MPTGPPVTTLVAFTVLVALVGLERLAELVVSPRNAAWSFARGGVESGQGHYPVMVVLHTGFLVGDARRGVAPPARGAAAAGLVDARAGRRPQALRWWCITHLGPRWNTRVIVVPGLPPVAGGPYRCLRHPNYVAVVVEGFALPLVHGAWVTARRLHASPTPALLTVRIRAEDAALATLPASELEPPDA